MKHFIAYFDYLGFKEYILQNSEVELQRQFPSYIHAITSALSETYKILSPESIVSDLSQSNINCLNISDTVIFWSKDDSLESCKELIEVAYRFNINSNLMFLPSRGCIIHDDFNFRHGQDGNNIGTFFGLNFMYGKGLINAHFKTEQLNWAGTVIDNSVVNKIDEQTQFSLFIKKYAQEYLVPYKGFKRNEYALHFDEGKISETRFTELSSLIKISFMKDGKSILPTVEEKMQNTIEFLRFHRK